MHLVLIIISSLNSPYELPSSSYSLDDINHILLIPIIIFSIVPNDNPNTSDS